MQPFDITCEDGTILKARLYGTASADRPLVVVAAATAVPQRFYGKIARFLEQKEIAVVTFDYRGIGDSKLCPLKGFDASLLIWAQSDLTAVIDWSLAQAPTAVLGHSFGGQAFGLVPRCNETLGLYSFGGGTGWFGFMSPGESIKVQLLWNLVGPILAAYNGYLPCSKVGLGEDLPLGAFRQWRHWCQFRHHWFDDPDFQFKDQFALVKRPILAVAATDDAWAPEPSVRAFHAGYSNADVSFVTITPAELGVQQIGHMGFFREICAVPWVHTADWIWQQYKEQSKTEKTQTTPQNPVPGDDALPGVE